MGREVTVEAVLSVGAELASFKPPQNAQGHQLAI